ncbi:MAG: response regulator transcription factor [Leadbetterella sp.]
MTNKYQILIADDDPDILELLEYSLKIANYEVILANDGQEAIDKAIDNSPDLIILDYMMPIFNGLEVARQLKNKSLTATIPIIFLTARVDEETEVLAFETGAVDFVSKPVKIKAFVSRINSVLENKPKVLHSNSISLDEKTYSVYLENKEIIRLPKKEFELLQLLYTTPNTVRSREDLLSEVWGSDIYVGERTVDVHIRKIREKIGNQHIETLKGLGYMFVSNLK